MGHASRTQDTGSKTQATSTWGTRRARRTHEAKHWTCRRQVGKWNWQDSVEAPASSLLVQRYRITYMLVSLEPASRRAAASAGQVFYTEISMHPCNQSLAQCSLAQAILAIKHTALACAEPGCGESGSAMRCRLGTSWNQSVPKLI